jgi:hypothetical protein
MFKGMTLELFLGIPVRIDLTKYSKLPLGGVSG